MALSTFYLPIVVSEELHQATCIIEGAVKRKFQQAQNKKNSKFRTEQFTLHGCNWELNIYPNGDRLDSAGYVSVFLRCKSLPNGCDKIGVNVTIDCVEFNETFSGTYVYTEDSGWGCPQFLRRDRIYLSYHNQITIKISIDGIATFKDTCMTWTIYAPLLQRFKSSNEAHNSWVTVNCSIQLDEDISEETLRMQQNLKKKYVIDSVIKMEDIALESDVKNNDIDEEYKHLVQDNESRVNAWSNTTKRLRASVEQIKTSGKMANIDHNDRDNDDEKRGNEPSIVYNALYQTFIRNGQLMAQQSKRMNQIINDGHIPKLITTHPRLAKQIESLQSTYDLQTEEGDILNKQYEEVKARRVMLTDTIEKAVQECNETIAIENKLTGKLKQNAQTTASVAEQQSQLTSVSQRVLSLIDAFNKFEHDNTEYIKTINSHINAKWSAFESKWWEWSRIDIMSWFAYKTRERNTNSIDWMNVQKEIAKRNISGESLENFSESTLDLIGIHDFNIAVHLMKEIATLRNRYYKNGDNDEHCTNDGHQKVVPSKFICPLTKRIMKNPVMAFDGNTYEHEAIEKYLKQHGKSPVTNEKAYTLNLYSHRQLQKEIQSYSSLNDFVESNEGCLMEDEETGNTVDVD
eukprot:326424_1